MTSLTTGQRLMGAGYAKVLRAVIDGFGTYESVSSRCGISNARARLVMNGMERGGVLRIARWEQIQRGRNRCWTAVFEFGTEPSARNPVRDCRSVRPCPAELLSFCTMVKALQENSWHGKGLAAYLGTDEKATRRTLAALHRLRLCYVDDYSRLANGGNGYPMYTFGVDRPNMKKPAPKTKEAMEADRRARQSALRRNAEILHAMVSGKSIDGRRATSYRRTGAQLLKAA